MVRFISVLIFTFSGALTGCSEEIGKIPKSEFDALYDLYESTNGDGWFWNTQQVGVPWNFSYGADPCYDHWQGVMCNFTDPNQPRIREVRLPEHNLIGSIPESIGNLTTLDVLGLDKNWLYGTIPNSIGTHLTLLTRLELSLNSLSGTIPSSLGELIGIEVLGMSENYLRGAIPACLGNLTSLVLLDVHANMVTGPIPESFKNLHKLSFLFVEDNFMTGTIPEFLCNVRTMNRLELSFNYFSGTVPNCLGSLTDLHTISIIFNEMTGTIPNSLGNLSKLGLLWLTGNNLVGTIPPSMCDLHLVTEFSVDINYLTGPIPPCLGQDSLLKELYLFDNSLTGTIPASLGNATHMVGFTFQNNHFTGTIPEDLGNLSAVSYMYLSNNYLTGTLPRSFASLRALGVLLLQQNFLTGRLDGVFNPSAQPNVTSIQVDNNHFTGSLPTEMFLLPLLNTFVGVSNCFTGTLSSEICKNNNLVSLVLDGAHTASACRKSILPTLSESYFVVANLHGSIPTCLFTMPNLTSLHISGNGFTGNLPDIPAVGRQLVDLKLSYNILTGTIPEVFQKTVWKNLDLSNNRLTGELIPSFSTVERDLSSYIGNLSGGSVMDLHNNRLSGHLPTSLHARKNISVLGTNLFTCQPDHSDLPVHDPNRDNYECDSYAFNIPFYVYLVLLVAGVCIFSAGYNIFTHHTRAEWFQKWIQQLTAVAAPSALQRVFALSDLLCSVGVVCACLIVIVLVPWYTAASRFYGTYDHQYAWTVSAAFLSGTTVAVVEVVMYLCLTVFFLCQMISGIVAFIKTFGNSGSTSSANIARLSMSQRLYIYVIFVTINLIVVVGVNVAFVYVALYQTNIFVVFSQLAMSFFKLFWNGFAVRALIKYIDSTVSITAHDTRFVTVQVLISLVNNIAIPCLVVAVVSPSCFYSVFRAPSAVDSSFLDVDCIDTSSTGGCNEYAENAESTSFNPPFRYDYQCSSSFITYYAPAYVYLSITAAFIAPLVRCLLVYWYAHSIPSSCWNRHLLLVMPRILRPQTRNQGVSEAEEGCEALQSLYFPYFDGNVHIISLLTYLGILMTFGVVFPPLAVAMSVTMLSVSWQRKIEVGRFLHSAEDLPSGSVHSDARSIIENDCRSGVTVSAVVRSVLIIVCGSCAFYALFLYDTLGDAVGWRRALWVLIVTPLFPLALFGAGWWAVKLQLMPISQLTGCLSNNLQPPTSRAVPEDQQGVSMSQLNAPVVLALGQADKGSQVSATVLPASAETTEEEATFNILQV